MDRGAICRTPHGTMNTTLTRGEAAWWCTRSESGAIRRVVSCSGDVSHPVTKCAAAALGAKQNLITTELATTVTRWNGVPARIFKVAKPATGLALVSRETPPIKVVDETLNILTPATVVTMQPARTTHPAKTKSSSHVITQRRIIGRWLGFFHPRPEPINEKHRAEERPADNGEEPHDSHEKPNPV